VLLNLADPNGFVIRTNSAQGIEMRLPEDCFPAVAYYRNGRVASCALDAAFVVNELILVRTLAGVDVLPGFS